MTRNPADGLGKRLPRSSGEVPKLKWWNADQLVAFLESVEGDRLHPLWHVMVVTGMRRGEALALRWDDVDFERAQLAVTRSRTVVGTRVRENPPKSGKGRVIHLDPETVSLLQNHAASQAWRRGGRRRCLEVPSRRSADRRRFQCWAIRTSVG